MRALFKKSPKSYRQPVLTTVTTNSTSHQTDLKSDPVAINLGLSPPLTRQTDSRDSVYRLWLYLTLSRYPVSRSLHLTEFPPHGGGPFSTSSVKFFENFTNALPPFSNRIISWFLSGLLCGLILRGFYVCAFMGYGSPFLHLHAFMPFIFTVSRWNVSAL